MADTFEIMLSKGCRDFAVTFAFADDVVLLVWEKNQKSIEKMVQKALKMLEILSGVNKIKI